MIDRCERTLLIIAIVLLLAGAIVYPHWATWPLVVLGALVLWLGRCIANAPVVEGEE